MILKQVDLSGVTAVQLAASAPKAQLNAAGGKLQLRLGSPEGTLVGESEFLEASDAPGFAPSIISAALNIPESDQGKSHDLYLLFINEKVQSGSLMVVMGIELKMANAKPIVETPVASAGSVKGDFFSGKWDLTFKGTPNGDSKMIADFVRTGGKLTGQLLDPKGVNPAIPVSQMKESGDQLGFNITAQGFNVNVQLSKSDANTMKGKMMDMFEAVAVRL